MYRMLLQKLCQETLMGNLKDNIVYNRPDNVVMVKSQGDKIVIICRDEDQVQPVMDKMNTDTCFLSDYEEWDDEEDMKWILTFKVLDEFDTKQELN